MKKYLLSLMCVAAMAPVAMADSATWTASAQGYDNAEDVTEFTVEGVCTVTLGKGDNNNSPKYYNTGKALRLYGGNTLRVQAADGVTLTTIEFTCGSSNKLNAATTVSAGDWDQNAATWTLNGTEGTLTNGGTSGHARVEKITFTYTTGGEVPPTPTLAKPVISLSDTEYNTVVITCATEGATIHYSVNGGELKEYAAPFTISEMSEVEAMSELDGETSDVVKATLYPNMVTSLAAFKALQSPAEVLVNCPLTAIAGTANNKNVYVTDGTDYAIVFNNNGNLPTVNNGDTFEGAKGVYTIYNEALRLNNASFVGEATVGAAVEPATFTIAEITTADAIRYVVVEGTSVYTEGSNRYIKQGNFTARLYNSLGVNLPEDGDGYDVYGIVSYYNGELQILPMDFVQNGEVLEAAEAPEFSVEAGKVAVGTAVEITCATEGATIMFAIDDAEYAEYAQPITLGVLGTTTIKAYATAEGYLDSDVVTVAYTVYDPDAPIGLADELTIANFPNLGNSYSGDTYTAENGITYSAYIYKATGDNAGCIQMNNKKSGRDCGIVISANTRDLTLVSLEVDVKNGSSVTTFDVYAKDTAYSSEIDSTGLADWAGEEPTNGTLVAEAVVSFVPNLPYKYVALVPSATGVSYINSVKYTWTDVQSGIEFVETVNASDAVYYNLQGVRVANPANGVYIVVRGNKVSKEYVK